MTDETEPSDAELMEVYQEPAPELSARAARILLALAGGMAALAAFALAFSWIDSTSSDSTCGSVVESSYWRDGRPADCGTVMPIRAALVALFVVVAVVMVGAGHAPGGRHQDMEGGRRRRHHRVAPGPDHQRDRPGGRLDLAPTSDASDQRSATVWISMVGDSEVSGPNASTKASDSATSKWACSAAAIGPLLEEHHPERMLDVVVDGVADATRLEAGAVDVLEARGQHLVEVPGSGRGATGDDDHGPPSHRSLWSSPRHAARTPQRREGGGGRARDCGSAGELAEAAVEHDATVPTAGLEHGLRRRRPTSSR